MSDPWSAQQNDKSAECFPTVGVTNSTEEKDTIGFEDNFSPSEFIQQHLSLPDSKQYIEQLERKLLRIRRDTNILQQLAERREDCIRDLLEETLDLDKDHDGILDAPVGLGDSPVYEIYRHIRPVQPLSVGEIVHIVKHDQLEEQNLSGEDLTGSGLNFSLHMDSQFGEVFLFLTNLAWKCRITLPVLVTAVFMAMDIRLQIEINVETGQIAAEVDDTDEDDSDVTNDSWETIDSDEEDSDFLDSNSN